MSSPNQPSQPAEPPLSGCEVVDSRAFWRGVRAAARENGFSIVTGFAGGPVVIYGDRLPSQASAANMNSPFLSREQVADMLGCHPDTLSRKRAKLEGDGLRARYGPGSKLVYHQDDVRAFMAKRGLTGRRGRGRPRKSA